jgi:hypothetical protein
MALVLSVFGEAGKLPKHRRINAVPSVQKNSTGQSWDKPGMTTV